MHVFLKIISSNSVTVKRLLNCSEIFSALCSQSRRLLRPDPLQYITDITAP